MLIANKGSLNLVRFWILALASPSTQATPLQHSNSLCCSPSCPPCSTSYSAINHLAHPTHLVLILLLHPFERSLKYNNPCCIFCLDCDSIVFSRNAISISSNDLPFVSGIKMAHTIAVSSKHPAQRKYAPESLRLSSTGVVSATTKFVTQLLPCARFVADARVRCGCISATKTLQLTDQLTQ